MYDTYARALLGYFARRTGDPELALDLLSDTFLAAYTHRDRCRGRSDGEQAAWLFRIAATRLAGHYRRQARERRATLRLAGELRPLTDAEVARIHGLADSADGEAAAEAIAAAFAELSPDQQEAVRLRVIDERPYPLVSLRLGISEPTARARVSRGLRAMRRAIGRGAERRSG